MSKGLFLSNPKPIYYTHFDIPADLELCVLHSSVLPGI